MGIEFAKTFGAAPASDTAAVPSSAATQPKAQLWLNIGYTAAGANDDGSDRFVSLPVGIPLDTTKPVDTSSRNADYSQFQAARNDLLDQIMAAAGALAPGEDRILNLEIQLRRVDAPSAAPATDDSNRFVRKLAI